MKKNYLIIIFTFLFLSGFCSSTDTLLKASYTVQKISDHSVLNIIISLKPVNTQCDTCKNVFEKFFNNQPLRVGPNINDVKNTIINELIKNETISLFVKIPPYISEIINLLKNENDKQQANIIYTKNNIDAASGVNTSNSSTIINGKGSQSTEFTITINLNVKAFTAVTLPELKFLYENTMYTVAPLSINLSGRD